MTLGRRLALRAGGTFISLTEILEDEVALLDQVRVYTVERLGLGVGGGNTHTHSFRCVCEGKHTALAPP